MMCFVLSCAGIRNPLYVHVPSVISTAIDEHGNVRTISDFDILREADALSRGYKQHGNDALLIRNSSNSFLSMIGAASFGLQSKILSGMTMGIAGQQSVWDEKSRSITFLQGASYIDDAIGEYFYNVSELDSAFNLALARGEILIAGPDNKLSKPAAWLYKRLSAIKAVVNLSLIGLVTDAETLALASGDILITDKADSNNVDEMILKLTEFLELTGTDTTKKGKE